MANYKNFKINDNEIMFINNSRNTRSGFAHDSELFINDCFICKNSVHYLNRTWECYRYQSSMRGCVYNALEELKASLKEEYKAQNGVKRMTEKHQKRFNDMLCYNSKYSLYCAIIDELNKREF